MIRALFALALVAPAYAQVAACARCHSAIAASFAKTGMGRSFSRARPEAFPGTPYYQAASDSYFSMAVRDGKVYQRRWQVGVDGKAANVEEKQADYVLGSGNHAKTYLHLTARGTLQELPLGWYAEKRGYLAMNPGYDKPDNPGSTRAISYECMACHNGYPKIPAAAKEEGAEAQFLAPLPEGIDCQRCHGRGTEHIATSGAAAIVNPARLPPDREFEVCLQCHLETSSRLLPHSIQKHGRAPFSYVPGQPLGDFVLAFDRAPGQNQAVEVAGAPYRLRQSQCFVQSNGKLRCTTCHNPHDVRHDETATASYNRVCVSCHPAAHRAAENCVGCHMPKTRTDDAVHIVITDHRIQRAPPSPDPAVEKAEVHETSATSYRGPVTPYYPLNVDALYDAVAQVRDGSNLAEGLPQLASLIGQQHPTQPGFYVDLGEAYQKVRDLPRAVRAFEDAAALAPDSTQIPLKLANALMESRQWAKAEAILRRATVRGASDPLVRGQLGWTLWQQDKGAEAVAMLQKSLSLDAEQPEVHNYLGQVLLGGGNRAAAAQQFRESVRLMPGIAEWRAKLGGVEAALGNVAEARYQFEQAVRFKPEDGAVHLAYARFLASRGEEVAAEPQARAAVQFDPDSSGAHEILGALLLNRRDLDGALRELQEAVRIEPNLARAQYELGLALYSRGDSARAAEHLGLASKAGSREAAQFLKQIAK